jgi:hypothetical protein
MFPRRFFPARHFAPHYWGESDAGAPPTPTPTGNRGRRLVRYLWIESPRLENPLGEWVRQREDEEELFSLG